MAERNKMGNAPYYRNMCLLCDVVWLKDGHKERRAKGIWVELENVEWD